MVENDVFQSLLAEAQAQGGAFNYMPTVRLPAATTPQEALDQTRWYTAAGPWNSPAAQFRSALEQSYGPAVQVAGGGSYIPLERVGQYQASSPQAEAFASWSGHTASGAGQEQGGGSAGGVALAVGLAALGILAAVAVGRRR